ncbi:MAG: YkgJ family cysteine cluster protein [Chitinivibrionales bacterium]
MERIRGFSGKRPGTTGFKREYRGFLEQLDSYIQGRLEHEGKEIGCVPGCNECCFHWVTDVFSFETLLIGNEVISMGHVEQVRERLIQDLEVFRRISERSMNEDWILKEFHARRRPCPLLDLYGRCMIYNLRPVTCRLYFCSAAASHAQSEYSGLSPFLLGIHDELDNALEELHIRYGCFQESSLRASLLEYLNQRFY